jgi:hypothetical protein
MAGTSNVVGGQEVPRSCSRLVGQVTQFYNFLAEIRSSGRGRQVPSPSVCLSSSPQGLANPQSKLLEAWTPDGKIPSNGIVLLLRPVTGACRLPAIHHTQRSYDLIQSSRLKTCGCRLASLSRLLSSSRKRSCAIIKVLISFVTGILEPL